MMASDMLLTSHVHARAQTTVNCLRRVRIESGERIP
jgi:hypothetical protein